MKKLFRAVYGAMRESKNLSLDHYVEREIILNLMLDPFEHKIELMKKAAIRSLIIRNRRDYYPCDFKE